jgi:hypothetical protein
VNDLLRLYDNVNMKTKTLPENFNLDNFELLEKIFTTRKEVGIIRKEDAKKEEGGFKRKEEMRKEEHKKEENGYRREEKREEFLQKRDENHQKKDENSYKREEIQKREEVVPKREEILLRREEGSRRELRTLGEGIRSVKTSGNLGALKKIEEEKFVVGRQGMESKER